MAMSLAEIAQAEVFAIITQESAVASPDITALDASSKRFSVKLLQATK
jgi:hypothetical protein